MKDIQHSMINQGEKSEEIKKGLEKERERNERIKVI